MAFWNSASLPRSSRTPSLLQMEHSECGVVCLAMVLGHHGRWKSIESLRDTCGVSRDGSNAANLLQAARKEGFTAKGFSFEKPDFDEIPKPAILHWRFNHFVVLEGVVGDRFWINDPANGHQVLDRREVDEAFTGVVLTFEPAEGFVRDGKPPNWWQALRGYASEVKGGIALATALGLAMVVPGALMPMFSIIFVDHILVQGFRDWLPYLLTAIGAVALLQAGLIYLQQNLVLTLQTRLSVALNDRLLQKSLSLPLSFYAQRSAPEIAGRALMVDQLAGLISGPLGQAVIGLGTALIYLAIMVFFDPLLSGVIAVVGVLNLLYFWWQVRRVRELNQIVVRESAIYTGAQMQALQLLPEVKSSGLEDQLFSQLVGRKAKWLNENDQLTIQRTLVESLPVFLQVGTFAIVLFVGGHQVINGAMTLGVLIAFQGLATQFMRPIQQMLTNFTSLQQTQGNLDRIEDIFRQPSAAPPPPHPEARPANRPVLKLENVTFGYQRLEQPLLRNFNLEVEPGKWIALVGPSGSGKSTVARLLCRLHEPWSGQITLGGRPLAAISATELRDTIAVVDQNIVLFNATVAENLSLWGGHIRFEQLVKAAQAAQIHDWIINRPSGYDHKIAEQGSNLSGGEKARLEIARALASQPTLIILDEATAALDPAMEHQVMRAVRQSCAGGIIISHRIEPIADCDEIIVFKDGAPTQRGTHQELMAEPRSLYAKLLAAEQS